MQLVLIALLALQGQQEADRLQLDFRATDEKLAEKLKGRTDLKILNLTGCWKITDAGLVHLKGLTNLKKLSLGQTRITDAGLAHLKGLTKLEYLNLYGTKITDAGLAHLEGLTNLKSLNLGQTRITDAGVKSLQEAMPDCKIRR